jgi:hypothetical protein
MCLLKTAEQIYDIHEMFAGQFSLARNIQQQ